MFPRAVWGFRLGGGGSVGDLGVQMGGDRGFRLGGEGSDWVRRGFRLGSDWLGFRLGGEGSDWATDQTQSQLLLSTFWRYVYLGAASLEIQSSTSIFQQEFQILIQNALCVKCVGHALQRRSAA